MKINIAILFDKNYLVRTLAFYEALKKLDGNFELWFLCLNEETKKIMQELNLPDVNLIIIEDLKDNELMSTKKDRSPAEFAFTAKSVFTKYVAERAEESDGLILSDNDVIFFQSPIEILERMKKEGNSIGITPHKFPKKKSYMNEKVGKYNAGLVFFIVNDTSKKCISDWRADCVDWCYLREEKDRFADQKYMVRWPERYSGVYEILDKGVNTGSWNLLNWKVAKKENGSFLIDEDPLICYHFHRIKFYIDGNRVKLLPIYLYHKELYEIHIKQINEAWQALTAIFGEWSYGFAEKPNIFRLWKQMITAFIRRIKGNKSED